jgi:hypothetical protein
LYWTLKQTNFISNQQFGFQRNKSTIDAWTIITEDIYSSFNIKQHVLLTSLDIEKAYDMVWRHRILDILQKNKINGNTLAYISNFLSKRSFSVKLNETHSSNHNLQNDISQEWSLSVTLFIKLFTNFQVLYLHHSKLLCLPTIVLYTVKEEI